MSKISEHIREAACADAPEVRQDGSRTARSLVGSGPSWKVLALRAANESFYRASEEQQRLFLLFVAEALE